MKNKIIDAVDLPDETLDQLVKLMENYTEVFGAIWNYSLEKQIDHQLMFNALLNSFINFMADRSPNEGLIKSISEITSKIIQHKLDDLKNDNF
jgi:hypothetical protein